MTQIYVTSAQNAMIDQI